MSYTWLEDYCLSKKGAIKDYQEEGAATRYMVCGKMFLMDGENREEDEILTLKLEPEFGQLMRNEYQEITPGYYMNKVHWNSIPINGSVPDDLLKDMIDRSYALVFGSFSKKKQKELLT